MRLTDLNREGGIGANSLFIEIDGFNLIVDAGLNPKLAGSMATPDFSVVEDVDIDLIIITHCHLDHSPPGSSGDHEPIQSNAD